MGFTMSPSCYRRGRVYKVTQPKVTCVTQRTIHVDVFLHHLGVIGSSFTEVEFHAFTNISLVRQRGVAVTALRHEPL